MIVNLNHIGFVVQNLDNAVSFYRDVIGLTLIRSVERKGSSISQILGYEDTHIKAALMDLGNHCMLELIEYLSEKLDDLLEGINESYGTLLMEELLARLELTVKDFNEEMKILCDQLVKKEQERQQLLEILKSSEDMPIPTSITSSDAANSNSFFWFF